MKDRIQRRLSLLPLAGRRTRFSTLGWTKSYPNWITFKELNERWTRQLGLVDGVPYFHVPYESLTGPDLLRHLQASIGLLGPAGVHLDLRSLSSRGVLLQLHRSSCRDRLSQQLYAAMDAQPLLAASMAVCRTLGGHQSCREGHGAHPWQCTSWLLEVAGIAPHDATFEVKVVQRGTTSPV